MCLLFRYVIPAVALPCLRGCRPLGQSATRRSALSSRLSEGDRSAPASVRVSPQNVFKSYISSGPICAFQQSRRVKRRLPRLSSDLFVVLNFILRTETRRSAPQQSFLPKIKYTFLQETQTRFVFPKNSHKPDLVLCGLSTFKCVVEML